MSKRGIILLAIGEKPYAYWAHNMLVSIRANSNLPVTIVTNNYPGRDWHLMPDNLVEINDEDLYLDGKVSPALAKLSLWKYSPYEETIYLDVDGCLIREIDFDIKGFLIHVNGYLKKSDSISEVNLWAEPEKLYDKYDIPEENNLPGTNSSFMAWDEKGKEVLIEARRLLVEDPYPLVLLKYQWGKSNSQPDELYINIAMAKMGIEIDFKPLFTRKRNANGGYVGFEYIKNFYVICCWGGLEFNAFEISGTGSPKTGLYNKLMTEYFTKVHGENTFYDHFYSLISQKIYDKGIKNLL